MFSDQQFANWMALKYQALGTHANADLIRSQGSAAADTARATLGIPAEAAHNRAIAEQTVPAQAGLYGAEAAKTNEQAVGERQINRLLPNLDIVDGKFMLRPQAPTSPGGTGGAPMSTSPTGLDSLRRFFGGGMTPIGIGQTITPGTTDPGTQKPNGVLQEHTGTARVPGKGDGTVDTVAAELAPGEAVLNRGAAEHLGRDNIKALNTLGMLHMGMVDPKGGKQDTQDDRAKGPAAKAAPAKGTEDDRAKPAPAKAPKQDSKDNRAHYVGGHSNVGKGKKSDTPKVDPQMLQQVISMMGGGMPQQAQPQPMPGGMP